MFLVNNYIMIRNVMIFTSFLRRGLQKTGGVLQKRLRNHHIGCVTNNNYEKKSIH
jgi:hypothetical protein